MKNWTRVKNEYYLLKSKGFQWVELVDGLKTHWKQSIREQNTNLNSLSLYDHQKSQVYSVGKLNSMELYNILISGN